MVNEVDKSMTFVEQSMLIGKCSMLSMDKSAKTMEQSMLTVDKSMTFVEQSMLTGKCSMLSMDKSMKTVEQSMDIPDKKRKRL